MTKIGIVKIDENIDLVYLGEYTKGEEGLKSDFEIENLDLAQGLTLIEIMDWVSVQKKDYLMQIEELIIKDIETI